MILGSFSMGTGAAFPAVANPFRPRYRRAFKRLKLPINRMKLISSTGYAIRLALFSLFYGLVRHLPDSTVPGGGLWRLLRYAVCRKLFLGCGENVNIERGAYIGSGRSISIGSHSGIGINASIGRGTRIGSNVMMGRDVLILTTNHRTSSTETPMVYQGYEPTAPVTIGDDVWIGARAIILPGVKVGSGSIIGAGAVQGCSERWHRSWESCAHRALLFGRYRWAGIKPHYVRNEHCFPSRRSEHA